MNNRMMKMIQNPHVKAGLACAVLVAAPWLLACALALSGFLSEALLGVAAPAFKLPVSIDYFWTATRWAFVVASLLFGVSTFITILFPRHHDTNPVKPGQLPKPYVGGRRKRH